eukprot:TRINITY_DN122_c0_g5_i1.p1 TRINITY_DN122_c0_g5~~TRINITY_DN122_c0_g5_i1.p1  ORF type:complete len:121 (+),score=23.13 TRINITY_DN122_c0_g5_i1:73-435(+)
MSRKLLLFTKAECCLCDTVKFQINRTLNRIKIETIPSRAKISFAQVDITKPENAKYFELYQYDIPVVTLDGSEIFRHRIDEKKLFSLLAVEGASASLSHSQPPSSNPSTPAPVSEEIVVI